MIWEVEDPNLLILRAAAASIASYLFFNRGECSACALVDDLVIDDTHITLLLRHQQGKHTMNEGERNARQVPSSEAPRIGGMLAAFFTRARAMGPRTRRWFLAPAKEIELWIANTLSVWLTTAYTSALCRPPARIAWTSHNHRTTNLRHRSQTERHPMRRRLIHQLHGPRGEVY